MQTCGLFQFRHGFERLRIPQFNIVDRIEPGGVQCAYCLVEGIGNVAALFDSRRRLPQCAGQSMGRLSLLVGKIRSEEHTSELQSLMRISYAVFCLKQQKKQTRTQLTNVYTTHQYCTPYVLQQIKTYIIVRNIIT